MPVSAGLKRLLRIREMQEEQSGASLENALRELAQLQAALAIARQAAVNARKTVSQSARAGDRTGRVVGLQETRIAEGYRAAVIHRIADAEERLDKLRKDHLAIRLQRKQAETLAGNIVDADSRCAARKSQHDLDQWFRTHS